MSSTQIEVGGNLPLALLLPDGDTGKFPQARLFDQVGNLLSTHDLTHRALGLYTISGIPMPDYEWIVALFIVYDDGAHTIESATYVRTSETFVRSVLALSTAVDGAVTVEDALARANAMAAGKVIRTGNQYAYRDSVDGSTLFTNEDNDTERTPV